jgi:hypothetical protein
LFSGAALEIEFLNAISVQNDDARFLGVGGVDQHLLGHKQTLRGARRTMGPDAGCGRARKRRLWPTRPGDRFAKR